MSIQDFFEIDDYRKILERWLKGRPNKGHGERSKLAKAMKCHTAYVTHVLKDRAQLSLEQALRASRYMGQSEEECRYFLALLALDRAGSTELRALIKNDVKKLRTDQKDLKTRFKVDEPLELKVQTTYYSKWYYTVIHVCLTVPALQSPEALCTALKLSRKHVHEALAFLTESQLAERKVDGTYRAILGRFHLDSKSPNIQKHHTNWRIQAINSLDRAELSDLHYSSVISVHFKDEAKIREVLVQAIEEIRSIVKDSSEPGAVYNYNLDFFPLTPTPNSGD